MKKHEITWYESDDGKIFGDEYECADHETNLLFKSGGVSFCDKNGKQMDLNLVGDYAYNHATYLVFDRSNPNTKKIVDKLYEWYGWVLIKVAYKRYTAEAFILDWNGVTPIDKSKVPCQN